MSLGILLSVNYINYDVYCIDAFRFPILFLGFPVLVTQIPVQVT